MMANMILNDLGEWVRSVGSECSVERLKITYPKFISEIEKEKDYWSINAYPDEKYSWADVENLMVLHKIEMSGLECESLSEIVGIEY